jgi:hypothetical protein
MLLIDATGFRWRPAVYTPQKKNTKIFCKWRNTLTCFVEYEKICDLQSCFSLWISCIWFFFSESEFSRFIVVETPFSIAGGMEDIDDGDDDDVIVDDSAWDGLTDAILRKSFSVFPNNRKSWQKWRERTLGVIRLRVIDLSLMWIEELLSAN